MKLGDQPVHPTPWEDQGKPNGITLRQEFAKAALNGFIAGRRFAGELDIEAGARVAVGFADALLKELEKTHE